MIITDRLRHAVARGLFVSRMTNDDAKPGFGLDTWRLCRSSATALAPAVSIIRLFGLLVHHVAHRETIWQLVLSFKKRIHTFEDERLCKLFRNAIIGFFKSQQNSKSHHVGSGQKYYFLGNYLPQSEHLHDALVMKGGCSGDEGRLLHIDSVRYNPESHKTHNTSSNLLWLPSFSNQ